MPSRSSPSELRSAIAETLWAKVSAPSLAQTCDALGMPAAPANADPWKSKRKYVMDRLLPLRGEALENQLKTVAEEYGDEELASLVAPKGVTGIDGEFKNLIFAAVGAKPRIVLRDAISNTIEIVENADACLVYDRAVGPKGLTWGLLKQWWAAANPKDAANPGRALFARLHQALASPPEEVLFNRYCRSFYPGEAGSDSPALLPQVYLHYDPYTVKELGVGQGPVLARQRMDFLLLLPEGRRVVIEVDGKHHYADGDLASPRRYAEMVAEDRRLRLIGYEVYRFGGAELTNSPKADELVTRFFADLLRLEPRQT